MKKIVKIFLPLIILTALINACKKGDDVNPLADWNKLKLGSYLTLDSTLNLSFDYSQIETSTVGIEVTQYPVGQAVDHIMLYATENASYDTTLWHFVKSVPYTGEATKLTVTGAELANAYGVTTSDLEPGTTYTIYTRIITTEGYRFDVNTSGDNGGGGLVTGLAYNSAFWFTTKIICPFTSPVGGTYKVVRDDLGDWNAGDEVEVTDGPGSNQVNLSKVWPNPAKGTIVNPLLVNVNPVNGAATVPAVDFANYGTIYRGTGSGSVFSCTGLITLSITISGNPYRLILQKK